jgi:hypothetical protein
VQHRGSSEISQKWRGVIFGQEEFAMQKVDGLHGWSGNPQRLSVRGLGTVRLPGSPQFCDSQLRSHNLTAHPISCQNTGYRAVDHCLPNEELGSVAKLFPIVCKLMHEPQPGVFHSVATARPRAMRIASRNNRKFRLTCNPNRVQGNYIVTFCVHHLAVIPKPYSNRLLTSWIWYSECF